jgi:uncharacterized protein (TIGR02099 family)
VSTSLRRRLRRIRRLFAYGVAGLLILAALAVAIANQLLPLLSRHPAEVANWLGERLGQPVAIQAVDARWSRRGPLLEVRGLRIGDGAERLELGEAELQINAYAGFLPGVPMTELHLRAPALELTRDADGRWRLEGLTARRSDEPFDPRRLDGIGEVRIEGARLQVIDAASGRNWSLRRVDARLRTVGASFRLGLQARVDDGAPLGLIAELDRDFEHGRVWIGGQELNLAPWLGQGPLGGVEVVAARGDVGLWLDIDERRVTGARLEAELSPLSLRGNLPVALGASPDAAQVEARYGLERASAALRWQRVDDGWQVDIAQLELDSGDARTRLEDVSIRSGDGLRLRVAQLELGPLLGLAMLSDRPPPALRRWLYLAAPRGQVRDLDLDWNDSRRWRASGTLRDLGWQPASAPGVEGFSGSFVADAEATAISVASDALRVVAPGMLRAPLQQKLEGAINAFALDSGWRVEAAGLRFDAEDYDFSVDGGIEWHGDGSKPLLDLRAEVAPGPVTAAKAFWFLNRMPPRTVAWLDEALVEGQLLGGRAIVRGDADDWPFRGNEGRFEAVATLDDLRLRYRNDWPIGEGVSGTATFVNDSIEVDLQGTVLGNRIEFARGGIASFRDPVLELDVGGGGRGADLLALVRASPLQRKYGAQLAGLSVGGDGTAEVAMHIPLKPGLGETTVDGHVDLSQSDLAESRWGLNFADASGRVRFGHRGLSADGLRVSFAGAPAALSLAFGDYTSEASHAVEASLRGAFAADALLAPYPSLHWIQPFIEGTPEWNLQLNVPRSEDGAESIQSLRVRSDLVGAALTFPAPLRKDAGDRMPLDLAVELPPARGGIDLQLGELLRLRGRMPEGAGFTGVAAFGDAPDEALPASGLVAVGQVPVLDAAGWAGFAMSSGGGGAGLQRADLYAGELDLLDRAFAETRLRFTRAGSESLEFSFEGAALQGALQVPLADFATRGVTARMQRLHWPSKAPRAASTLASTNPASIPPLHLHIEDFRFGEALLGETRLETYPTPEGMHVQQLDTTSPDLALRASGDWTRIDGRERSSFRIGFSAGDLGDMLKALGFAELIEGGQTQVDLQATWPGPPSAFELQRVDGTLTAKVGKGRVPDVEPGAGRVFGLFSLTEIPRRLALDFSDFFKSGLAFNEITGTFTLDGGNAYTEDLRIDGPAAEIRVRGRTGLKVKDYDQTMEVLPRAGSMLPAIGAIAAGPAGAALGAVAQAVLQRPIKQMARTLYRVQGSWSTPAIDVIERGPARAERNARNGADEPAPAPAGRTDESLRVR